METNRSLLVDRRRPRVGNYRVGDAVAFDARDRPVFSGGKWPERR
jgi:hypothetical protein